jgi:hypothetical protein
MATINTPSRGQPIDVTLLSSIVDAIGDLQTTQNTATQSSINKTKASTSSLKFYGEVQSISINNITTSPEQSFSFFYPSFNSVPVAVAGVTNITSTVSGGNAATVVLTSVTRDRADGIVKFPSGSTGSVNIEINLIAIGLS